MPIPRFCVRTPMTAAVVLGTVIAYSARPFDPFIAVFLVVLAIEATVGLP